MRSCWRVGGVALAVLGASGAVIGAAADGKAPELRRHTIDTGKVWNGLAVADFNADGKTDVAAAGPEEIVWYQRETADRWTRHLIAAKSAEVPSVDTICLTVRDLDGDRDPDLLACTPAGPWNFTWYENPGDADQPWTRHLIDRLPKIHSQAFVDVDGDGRAELVANTEGQLVYFAIPKDVRAALPAGHPGDGPKWERQVLTRDGAGGTPHYLHLEQLPGRKEPVLCAGSPDGAYLAWWRRGAGAEWERHAFREGINGATHLRILDVDRDGKPDLFYARGHEAGSAWLAGPEWTRETAIDTDTLKAPHAQDLGDLNGDGAPDVAAAGRTAGGLVVWMNDGKGQFTRHQADPTQTGMDLQSRDLDGDGDLDLLVAGATGKNVTWYENTRRR